MIISTDSQAILSLCSHLGLSSTSEYSPFSLKEWNVLARKIQSLALRPGDILNFNTNEIHNQLEVKNENMERVSFLLQRSGSLAIELEHLESLGIYVVTRADNDYPSRYRQRLKESAPVILFYSGEKSLLGQPGIAIVGSRHLDDAGKECAEFVGNACGLSGLVLYSGGAKGVDSLSMKAALTARGTAVGLLAESLEKAIRNSENRAAISSGDLCLATPYSPSAPFSVGMAMGRNKLIYALSDFAIIVASDAEKGGTWAGATEALKAKWVPVFVLDHPKMPQGNILLIKNGAFKFPYPFPENYLQLKAWLENHATEITPDPLQPSLFN